MRTIGCRCAFAFRCWHKSLCLFVYVVRNSERDYQPMQNNVNKLSGIRSGNIHTQIARIEDLAFRERLRKPASHRQASELVSYVNEWLTLGEQAAEQLRRNETRRRMRRRFARRTQWTCKAHPKWCMYLTFGRQTWIMVLRSETICTPRERFWHQSGHQRDGFSVVGRNIILRVITFSCVRLRIL